MPSEPLPVFAFPHHVGPGTRGITTALLFHGRIAVTMPGWPSSRPITNFIGVGERAESRGHRLAPFLAAVYKDGFELAQKQALREMKALKALGGRVHTNMMVYPGTREAYSSWDGVRDSCLKRILPALDSPLERSTAAVELLWRVWEFALETGQDPESEHPDDPDRILEFLDNRCELAGGPTHLLAECALHRYCIPRYNAISLVVDSAATISVLAALGEQITEPVAPGPTERVEALSYFLFDRILWDYMPPLRPDKIPLVATIMDNHGDALESARRKCREAALELLGGKISEDYLSQAIALELQKMEEEAAEIAKIDKDTIKAYFAHLAQDGRVWAAIAGLLGSVPLMSASLSASLGVTALSFLGAGAVKVRRDKQQLLKNSPWRVVYYADHAATKKGH
jgi:hypothetical protein